jgi:HlyD family secretion protein
MDREIPTLQQNKNQMGQWFKYLIIIAVIAGTFYMLRSFLTTEIKEDDFRFGQITRGDIENKITATGLVLPSFEQQINAPVATEIKEMILTSGAEVQPGDLILKLDEEYVRLQYDALKDQLELRKNNITKLKLEYDKNLQDLDYQDQIKALQLASLEANLSDLKKLFTIGGATQEEVEQGELNLQIANLEKKQLENELNFKKESITSDRRNLELEVLIQEKSMRELGRKLKETSVKAPRAGVITWINENIGQKVNEGEPLVRIANLESFRVEASCSDRYANIVTVGLSVDVRINKTTLKGIITSILPAVENNTIKFVVALNQTSHKELRPNMRVEVFIISGKKENVLRAQNGPAFTGAKQQGIFVIRGEQAKRSEVQVGLSNAAFVEIITNELQEGDKIIVSDMKDFDHLETIEIK